MANRWWKNGISGNFIFLGSKITADGDCNHEIKRRLLLGRKVMTNLDSILKSRDITLLTNVHTVKAIVFKVIMYGCESWIIKAEHQKNWCFWTVCYRRPFRVSWTARRSKPVNLKENQPWIFIGRTDAEAEDPILWLPHEKSQLTRKDWCWERLRQEKGETEKEMVGWHHWLKGHEFEQTWGNSEGQGSLVCCMQFMGLQSDTT